MMLARFCRLTPKTRRLNSALFGLSVCGAIALLSGCATAPAVKEAHLVWPEPPETARIEFVRTIASNEDVAKDTTRTQSILKFLEGEKPAGNRIVEPMGIVVSDDGNRVYVSDNSQKAI